MRAHDSIESDLLLRLQGYGGGCRGKNGRKALDGQTAPGPEASRFKIVSRWKKDAPIHLGPPLHDTLRATDAVYRIFEYSEEVQKPKEMGSGYSSWWSQT